MILLGAIQSIIGTTVFLLRRPAHLSQRILAAWFAINALDFIGLLVPGGLVTYLRIGFVPFLFLIGPLFLFYLRSQIELGYRLQWRHAVHLLPFSLAALVRLIFFEESVSPTFYFAGRMPGRLLWVYLALTVSLLAYLAASFVVLGRHQRNLRHYFSNDSRRVTLQWAYVIVSLVFLGYLVLFFAPLSQTLSPTAEFGMLWYHQFNLALLATLVLVFGLLQPVIYLPGPVNAEERREQEAQAEAQAQAEPGKYARSSLDSAQRQAYAERIQKYLEERKPYRNADFDLGTMAKDLNITRQNLSQTINDHLGKNFYTLVNEHRIAEFKALLNHPRYRAMTFLALALEAGFNSKSSFYRAFKEVTGETPSEFQKRLKSEQEAGAG